MEKIDDERFDNGTKLFKSIISETDCPVVFPKNFIYSAPDAALCSIGDVNLELLSSYITWSVISSAEPMTYRDKFRALGL